MAVRFERNTGHNVRVVSASVDGRAALDNYRTLMDVGSPRLDVIQLPEAWIPALADGLAVIDAAPSDAASSEALMKLGIHRERQVAWPQQVAVTLLYMRNELVNEARPDDWSDVRGSLLSARDDTAEGLAFGGAGATMFPLFVDWVYSFGVRDLNDRPQLVAALQLLNDTIGTIAAPGLVETTASSALDSFVKGNIGALVGRSTMGQAISASDIASQVATFVRPNATDEMTDTPRLVSTWLVGVPRFSPHQDAARELAAFMVSEEEQRRAAIGFGLAPARMALYDDPEVRGLSPVMEQIAANVDNLVPLPVPYFGSTYLEVADQVAEAVRAMLRGEADPPATAAVIVRMIRSALRRANT
ncbi:extracellular solute-binding protein [Acuticoccus kandeliae]|uniref:extracellular solute-binding protein n=1 Tax=Acuticoccus kandeliae TaxID=2073160 RepID=UPI0013006D60|nr:extracellular solute-binding protein [Acuticoccus kandeliae]